MKTPKVSVYLRVTLPDGHQRFLKPAYANRRLKALHAIVDKKPEHFPAGVYYFRYTTEGKPCWEKVGTDAELVPDKLQKRKHALEGAALGQPIAVVPRPVSAKPQPTPDTHPPVGKQLLDETAKKYLDEIKEHRRRKTYLAYSLALRLFLEVCQTRKKTTLQRIDRDDLLAFISSLRDKRGERAAHPSQQGRQRAIVPTPFWLSFFVDKEKRRPAEVHKEEGRCRCQL